MPPAWGDCNRGILIDALVGIYYVNQSDNLLMFRHMVTVFYANAGAKTRYVVSEETATIKSQQAALAYQRTLPPKLIRMFIRIGSIRTSILLFVLIAVSGGDAEESANSSSNVLHQEIDLTVESVQVGPHSALSSDEEFCRRIHLDLVGRIPTFEESTRFSQESSETKRKTLIDRLLESDECDSYLAETFDIWWMERRKDVHVTTAEWRTFLKASFGSGKSYQQLVREILSSDGNDPELRPAAKFYLDRLVEAHAVTQDVSRMFLGRNIECAQCHDHPLHSDYLQSEYYGIFSLVDRSYLFTDDKSKKSYVGEKAEGDAKYSSVFEPDAIKVVALPKVVGGLALDREPLLNGDAAYKVKPAKGVRSVPTFSRRESLARLITHDTNVAFRQNIANRLWAHMMGRGLVDPVDLHQADNQPTNAALLRLLTDRFLSLNYDTKELLRQIARSKAYQRTIDVPAPVIDVATLRTQLQLLRVQHTDQKLICERLEADMESAQDEMKKRRKLVRENLDVTAKSRKEIADQEKIVQKLAKQASEIQKQHDLKQQLASAVNASLEKAKNASKQLKNDKSLAKTLEQIKSNSRDMNAQVEALAKRLAQQKKRVEEASSKVAPLVSSAERLESDHHFLSEDVAESRGVYRFFVDKLSVQNVALADIERRLAATAQTLKYFELAEQFDRKSEQLSSLIAQLNRQTNQLEADQLERASTKKRLTIQQKKLEEVTKSLTIVQKEVQAGEALVATLQEAVNQTESAIAQLAGDEALGSAVDTIQHALKNAADKQADSTTRADRLAKVVTSSEKAVNELKKQLTNLDLRHQEASKMHQQIATQVQAQKEDLNSTESKRDLAFDQMTDAWTNRFAVRPLSPLKPEQLGRSVVIALGMNQRFRQEAEAEWKSKNKDKKPEEIDEQKKKLEIDGSYEKRKKNIETVFVRLFAAAPGSPQDVFQSSVDQALFLGNDNRVKSWLSPRDGSLVKRLRQEKDANRFAETLYLSVLNRSPSEMEMRDVAEYLAARPQERNSAVDELVWGLLTSLEFRFNH